VPPPAELRRVVNLQLDDDHRLHRSALDVLGCAAVPRRPPSATDAPLVALATNPGDDQVADTTGAYAAWLADLGGVAILVRPDHHLCGAATDAEDPS
jgi:hypothetical protein